MIGSGGLGKVVPVMVVLVEVDDLAVGDGHVIYLFVTF